MVRREAAALAAVVLLAAGARGAEREESLRAAAAGACAFARGVADAEADVLLGPELFGRYGGVNLIESTADNGVTLGAEKQRLTVGLNYSLGRLYQGLQVRKRGDAECRKETARAGLESALYAGTDYAKGPALAAREKVLREGIPEGQKILDQIREDVRKQAATAEEMEAARLRLDALQGLLSQTVLERERLPAATGQPAPPAALGQLLQELRSADDEVEQIAGRLRSASAWDVSLRGAYDKVFDVSQTTSPPIFGMVTVSYNLGGLWQSSANERAREGRRQRAAEDLSGVDRRAAELLRQLRAMRSSEEQRLREVAVLTADLAQQLKQVQELQTSRVRRFGELLWFELTRMRAEQAFLQVHLKDLAAVLGEATQ
ncbi:MAG TPA: hypothetical protein VE964_08940 [Myxococcales bacterium]|nr:hypothetical protein [Myxococcales bacterium]